MCLCATSVFFLHTRFPRVASISLKWVACNRAKILSTNKDIGGCVGSYSQIQYLFQKIVLMFSLTTSNETWTATFSLPNFHKFEPKSNNDYLVSVRFVAAKAWRAFVTYQVTNLVCKRVTLTKLRKT